MVLVERTQEIGDQQEVEEEIDQGHQGGTTGKFTSIFKVTNST